MSLDGSRVFVAVLELINFLGDQTMMLHAKYIIMLWALLDTCMSEK
jgi:hypothetical protein